MVCKPISLPGGLTGFVCYRAPAPKLCKVCGTRDATKLCDFALRGRKSGSTCDAPLCDACAVSRGPELDYCPSHARLLDAEAAKAERPDDP